MNKGQGGLRKLFSFVRQGWIDAEQNRTYRY
jgi:hypothetical protein